MMVNKLLSKRILWLSFTLVMLGNISIFAQNSIKDTDPKNDIMFQSFGWNEHQQSRVAAAGGLYKFMSAERISYLSEAGFDMIWLPPASQSTGGVGYIPTKLFNFSQTSWGTEADLKTMLTGLNAKGINPIADIVVNHRGGTKSYTDFTEPTWGCETICFNDDGGSVQTATYVGCKPSGANDTGEDFSGARDLDHTNATTRSGVKEYLTLLKGLGFKGWRWDVAKGFSAQYFGEYNTASSPYYSVGEYWDGNTTTLKNWVDGTGGKSGAFDFSNYYTLSNAVKFNSYGSLNSGGRMAGLAGVIGYDDKAVTFVDNHDTFVKNEYISDSNVEKAYAYILTHPGIPCVWAAHYYGGTYTKGEGTTDVTRIYTDHQDAINKLMGVRKQNKINAYSSVNIVQSGSTYAAYISATFGGEAVVAVKLGAGNWSPTGTGWELNATGTDYTVWSKKIITIPIKLAEAPIVISLVGLGISDWSTDVVMTSTDNKNYTLAKYKFVGGPVKFRANADWVLNWGGATFPSGTGVIDGATDIPTTAGDYAVTFNRETGVYSFTGAACTCPAIDEPVCADFVTYKNPCEALCAGKTNYVQGKCVGFDSIGILGDAVSADKATQWLTDVDMQTTDGENYKLYYTFLTGEAKFRKNDAWTSSWGAATFPSGLGVLSGVNIPVKAGSYEVSFNSKTGAYTFTASSLSDFDYNPTNVKVSIHPNPTSSNWNIVADEDIKSVKLIDVSGKVISISESSIVSGAGLTTGLYFAIITTTNSIQTIKLIKQ